MTFLRAGLGVSHLRVLQAQGSQRGARPGRSGLVNERKYVGELWAWPVLHEAVQRPVLGGAPKRLLVKRNNILMQHSKIRPYAPNSMTNKSQNVKTGSDSALTRVPSLTSSRPRP